MHDNHKVLEICDEENLNKENMSIAGSINEFNIIIEKANGLKDKIEKEIDEINKLYDKTIVDLTNCYKRRKEELETEELKLKEKLDNEVTKIKEKLEIFLGKAKNELQLNERINKGIKNIENNEKNMLKILSYVSTINKNKKGFNSLFQELMQSIKPSFNEEKNEINFNEYYFNGVPIPKDIKHKDITFIDYNNYNKIE